MRYMRLTVHNCLWWYARASRSTACGSKVVGPNAYTLLSKRPHKTARLQITYRLANDNLIAPNIWFVIWKILDYYS